MLSQHILSARRHRHPPPLPTYLNHKFTSEVHTHLAPRGTFSPNLPRVGHSIQLSSSYSQVKWFGCGPLESYNDKYLSQPVGMYQESIEEMPQGNQNRTDVRWCSVSASTSLPRAPSSSADLTNTSNQSSRNKQSSNNAVEANGTTTSVSTLRARSIPGTTSNDRPHMQVSKKIYDPYTIENAKHICDLSKTGKRKKSALWRLDADVAGFGRGACGPGTEEKDQVVCSEREWTLILEVL